MIFLETNAPDCRMDSGQWTLSTTFDFFLIFFSIFIKDSLIYLFIIRQQTVTVITLGNLYIFI